MIRRHSSAGQSACFTRRRSQVRALLSPPKISGGPLKSRASAYFCQEIVKNFVLYSKFRLPLPPLSDINASRCSRSLKCRNAPNGAIKLADNLKRYAKDRDNAFAYYWRLEKIGPSELYDATAGEIEARDVENRLNYSAEQRKNTRPDIDRSDVVFADGNVSSFLSKGNESDSKD